MLDIIANRILDRERLSDDEALWCLSNESDICDVGRLAHQYRLQIHPAHRVTYQVDRNINYTNICITGCKFCAFSKPPADEQGWVLSITDVIEKVKETQHEGGTGILMQGGHNPDLPFQYYTDLLAAVRARFPEMHIHAFSPPEIISFSKIYKMPVETVLGKLISSGLDSLPGGGAEILAEPTRSRVAPGKCSGTEWIDVMRTAHKLGIKTTATMVIGFGESINERLEHLKMIRGLQDETGGFTAFIPWTFQPTNTSLESEFSHGGAGGLEYLRIQAAARLILDNVPHHQVSWVTQGLRLGSVALNFGADDFSSVMMEEKVVASTGVGFRTSETEMRRIIERAGFRPVKRLTLYQNILHG